MSLQYFKFPTSSLLYTTLFLSVFISFNASATKKTESETKTAKKIESQYQDILKQQGLNAEDFGRKKQATDNRVFTLSEQSQKKLFENMIWVNVGSFTMGSNAPEATNREKPPHKVTLDGFFIGRTEVTQALFEELMGWNTSYFQCPQCAVNNVSWSNIQLFIERLNKVTGKLFRLPTEAEWEYAAKGGNKSKNYKFSGSNDIADVAWFAENANKKSHPVATKKPNELGLYDMTGNLWEFVQDDMSRHIYTKDERKNPLYVKSSDPKQKSMKVIRGGGYEFSATESLVFKRDGATSNVRMPDIGFRLALTAK
jgi:formylglycine-generating enzyme required for sulfatase activity